MCDEFASMFSNVTVVHKKNGGLGLARNSGMEVATGEFVAFVDSDDYIEPNMMEVLYSECLSNDLDVIYSEFNTDEYPGYRVVPHKAHLYQNKEVESLMLDFIGAEPQYTSSVKYEPSACKGLYSLDLIKKHGVKFLSEREFISEDVLFNLDVLNSSKRVKIVPYQFYHYCLNGGSLTHSYRSDRWEKQCKMIRTLETYKKYFVDSDSFDFRLTRTAMAYFRMAATIELHRCHMSYWAKYRSVKKMLDESILQERLKFYPISCLPRAWYIFAFFMKKRLCLGLCALILIKG
jgi:glycosyltransferase involved in cell wall biosynthesis